MVAALREQAILSRASQVELVVKKIYRRLPNTIQFEDMVQAGWMGAIEAVDHHNPDVSTLSSYAALRIRGSVLDFLRRVDPLSRGDRKKFKDAEAKAMVEGATPVRPSVRPPSFCDVDQVTELSAPGDFVADFITARTVHQLRRRARLTDAEKLVLQLHLYEEITCTTISRDVLHGCASLAASKMRTALIKLRKVA